MSQGIIHYSPQSAAFRKTTGLLALVAVCIAVRLPGIGRPLVGNFASKQTAYAMIARNWVEGRASLVYPTLDCLRQGKRSLHMLEFPLSAYLSGALWKWMGGSLDAWGRATSIAFSAGAAALVYLLAYRRHGRAAAWGSGLVMAISPVAIVYGQSFMLEASLAFFLASALYSVDRWLNHGSIAWACLLGLSLSLALLTKIYAAVFLLPIAADVWRKARCEATGARMPRGRLIATAAAVMLAALAPAALWYGHAARTAAPTSPLAPHVFYSVRQSAAVHLPPHPILARADFYRHALDDLTTSVLGPVGCVLALLALTQKAWRLYVPWLIAAAALVLLLPLKFYEMNYYWLPLLPGLAMLVGLGWQAIRQRLVWTATSASVLGAVTLLVSLRYAVGPAFATPDEDAAVITAARAVRQRTAPEEPVVTIHGSTTDLLYYCQRPGWALAADDPQLASSLTMVAQQGGRVLAIAGPRRPSPLITAGLDVLARGEDFVLYRLDTLHAPRSGL